MPSAAELGDAFYSGSLFGTKADPLGKLRSKIPGLAPPTTFTQDAYDRATKAGYSNNDINKFLRESGLKAEGSPFQVGGMADYSSVSGTGEGRTAGSTQQLYWQVTPSYVAPQPFASTVTAPSTANTVDQTIKFTNGIGTIESIAATPTTVSASAPVLGDPLGETSQRVQRQKARLTIAQ